MNPNKNCKPFRKINKCSLLFAHPVVFVLRKGFNRIVQAQVHLVLQWHRLFPIIVVITLNDSFPIGPYSNCIGIYGVISA